MLLDGDTYEDPRESHNDFARIALSRVIDARVEACDIRVLCTFIAVSARLFAWLTELVIARDCRYQ